MADFSGKSGLFIDINQYGVCGSGCADVGQLLPANQSDEYGAALISLGMGTADSRHHRFTGQ